MPQQFDFLSIDVEGHDDAVLRSLNFDQFQPLIILVEVNGIDFQVGNAEQCWSAQLLRKERYELMAVNWSNLFFKRVASS